jgi:YD repeat-containing protein
MSLNKEYVRNGKRQIIGSVTTGYSGGTSDVVRDEQNQITGRTSEQFQTTRDEHGELVSINTADAGLLIDTHKK